MLVIKIELIEMFETFGNSFTTTCMLSKYTNILKTHVIKWTCNRRLNILNWSFWKVCIKPENMLLRWRAHLHDKRVIIFNTNYNI